MTANGWLVGKLANASQRSSLASPFEEWASLPDVCIANTASRRLCDILLLKELLNGLGHHTHGIVDVRRLVLAIDKLKAEQACPVDNITWCWPMPHNTTLTSRARQGILIIKKCTHCQREKQTCIAYERRIVSRQTEGL